MKLKNFFLLFFCILIFTSCNFFEWMDSNGTTLEACKDAADSGKINKAISICEKVLLNTNDKSSNYPEINLELGDLYLRKVGMSLPSIMNIVLKEDACQGINCFLGFAEGLLSKGTVKAENKASLGKAIYSFTNVKTYWTDKGNSEKVKASDFFITLANVSKLTFLLAYSDVADGGDDDGTIDKEDICGAPACVNPISQLDAVFVGFEGVELLPCIEDLGSCDGISADDAGEIFQTIEALETLLGQSFGIDQLENNINQFLEQEVLNPKCLKDEIAPADILFCTNCIADLGSDPECKVTISSQVESAKGDIARKVLYELIKNAE